MRAVAHDRRPAAGDVLLPSRMRAVDPLAADGRLGGAAAMAQGGDEGRGIPDRIWPDQAGWGSAASAGTDLQSGKKERGREGEGEEGRRREDVGVNRGM